MMTVQQTCPLGRRKSRRKGNRWRKNGECCVVNAAPTQGKEGGTEGWTECTGGKVEEKEEEEVVER